MAKKRAQKWEVGRKVRIGGNQYWVTGFAPPRAKGQARVTLLSSIDRTKDYEWVPFAGGLTLIRGDLVRPARAERRRAERAAEAARKAQARASGQTMQAVVDPASQVDALAARVLERLVAMLTTTPTPPPPPPPPPPATPPLEAADIQRLRDVLAQMARSVKGTDLPQDGAAPRVLGQPIAAKVKG